MLVCAARRTLLDRAVAAIATAGLLVAAAGCRTAPKPAAACESCADADTGSDCESCNPICGIPSPRYIRCIDETFTRHEAIHRAEEAMRCDYNVRPSADVQAGYRAAFVDIALGGSGKLPPVPPQAYWDNCNRSASGHARAQDWFDGYAAGAAHTLGTCRESFNSVPSSGQSAFDTVKTATTLGGDQPSFGPATSYDW